VQDQIHHEVLLEEAVASREGTRAEKGILHDAHDGLVRLWRHDAARREHDLGALGARLVRLQHVHVHLVAVKVGIVRRGTAEIHPEGGVGHNLDAVAHDRHFVQRRLPVEHDDVAVLHVPLHLVPGLQRLLDVWLRQVETQTVVADDVACAGQRRRPIFNELLQLGDVEGRI